MYSLFTQSLTNGKGAHFLAVTPTAAPVHRFGGGKSTCGGKFNKKKNYQLYGSRLYMYIYFLYYRLKGRRHRTTLTLIQLEEA